MSPQQARRRVHRGRLLYVAATAAVGLFFVAGWVLAAVRTADPLTVVMGDWIQFHRVGQRLAAGDWARLYPDAFPPGHHPDFPDGLYFLYPPFALPGTLVFAGMTLMQAYWACVAIVLAAGAGMVTLLVRTLRGTTEDGALIGLGLLASGFFLGGLALGHLSVLLGLVIAAGLYLHQHSRRSFAAGAVWALLLVKPNWGIPLLMLLVVGCRWREVAGFATMGVSLVVVGVLLDHGLWGDWLHMIQEYSDVARSATPPHRQVTLFASLQSLLGLSGASGLLQGLWATSSAALAVPAAWLWWKGRRHPDLVRLLAMGIVVILAVNPYAYFYDGVPLVAAAAVWWVSRASYRRLTWRVIGAVLVFVMVWEHLVIWTDDGSGLPSLAGLAVAVWGLAEIVDLGRWPTAVESVG